MFKRTESDAERDVSLMMENPGRAVKLMAIPLVFALLIAQINSFVDAAWCATLGSDALAVIGLSSALYLILVGIGTGIGVGGSTAVARRIGLGDHEGANSRASHAIALIIVISLILTPILLILRRPLLALMGAGVLLDDASDYAIPMFLGSSMIMLSGVIAGLLRAENAVKRSVAVLITGSVLNLILDPVFIFYFDLGVTGSPGYRHGHHHSQLCRGILVSEKEDVHPPVPTQIQIQKGYPQRHTLRWDSADDRACIHQCREPSPELVRHKQRRPGRPGDLHYALHIHQHGHDTRDGGGHRTDTHMLGGLRAQGLRPSLAGLSQHYPDHTHIRDPAGITIFIGAEYLVTAFTYSPDSAGLKPEMAKALRIYCMCLPFWGMIPLGSAMLQSLRKAQKSTLSAVIRNLMLIAFYAFASTISLEAIFWSFALVEVIGGTMMYLWGIWAFKSEKSRYLIPEPGAPGPS